MAFLIRVKYSAIGSVVIFFYKFFITILIYQLALVTPGISPPNAISLKLILDIPNILM